MDTNIDYWGEIVRNPSDAYTRFFSKEKEYIRNNVNKNEKVLDVGCGDGRNILSITDITNDITGIDIDQKAVDKAKRNLSDYPNIQVYRGSALQLPFEDSVFDVSILSMTLVNLIDNKIKALQELGRVTKRTGRIIISIYSEKAYKNRVDAYEQTGVKIIGESNGRFIFEGENFESEQFSLSEARSMFSEAGLEIKNYEEVEDIAYLFTLGQY